MRRPDQRGETLVEVVMALGILSLVLVSSYALATSAFRLGRGAGERTQAVNYLQEQAEALRAYRDTTDWDPTFMAAMAPYVVGQDRTFCMVKDVTTGKWGPSATNCLRDAITVAITATPINTSYATGEQYRFELVATWKAAGKDNNVRLTTKLVRQE